MVQERDDEGLRTDVMLRGGGGKKYREPRIQQDFKEDVGKDTGKDASQVSNWATRQMFTPFSEGYNSRESSFQGTKTFGAPGWYSS